MSSSEKRATLARRLIGVCFAFCAAAIQASPPVVTKQPEVVSVAAGTPAVFAVEASGTGPLGYQWRRLGVPLVGETGASLTLPAAEMADAGFYDVVVNDGGETTTSLAGQLFVAPASFPGLLRLDQDFAPLFEHGAAAGYVTAELPDGRLYYGGQFSTMAGARRNLLLRLLPDGAVDPTFAPAIEGRVVSGLAVQPDGKLLIAGEFSVVNGVERLRFARLNSDGSLDVSFVPPPISGGGGLIRRILPLPDGRIVVGSTGTMYVGGLYRFGLARFSSSGALDPTFAPVFGSSSPDVFGLVRQADGRLVVAGGFLKCNGVTRGRIARLNPDGTLDAGFAAGTGFDSSVTSLVQQADGALVLGGGFSQYSGVSRNRIARLNADGSLDGNFDPAAGFDGRVDAVATTVAGQVLATGTFTQFRGEPATGVLRLNSDGSRDPGLATASGATVLDLRSANDGTILIAGTFVEWGGLPAGGLVRLAANGAVVFQNSGRCGAALGEVFATVPSPGGRWLVGGQFSTVNGVERRNLARLNSDGTLDLTFDPGSRVVNPVRSLALRGDGSILVGTEGAGAASLLCLSPDGNSFPTFNVGGGFSPQGPTTIAVQPDGAAVAGGSFTSFNGTPAAGVVRLTSVGGRDSAFAPGSGEYGTVANSLLIRRDASVLVGGQGLNFGQRLVRFLPSGALDKNFLPGGSFNGEVQSFAALPNSQILVGGSFTWAVNSYHRSVVRLNADFLPDPAFAQGVGFDDWVQTVLPQADGKVIASGRFTSYDGVTRKYLARLGPTGKLDPAFTTPDIRTPVYRDLKFAADGRLLLVDASASRTGRVQFGLVMLKEGLSPAPAIIAQPTSQSANPGETVTFTVAATGDDLAFQWLKNGVAIPGANGATLSLTNVQLADVADYTVVVSNGLGSVSSNTATVVDSNPPVITQPPGVVVARHGSTATISAVVTSGSTPTFQWSRLGVPIPGATSSTLTLNNVTLADDGRYDLTVESGLSRISPPPGWLIFQSAPGLLWAQGGASALKTFRTDPQVLARDVVACAARGRDSYFVKRDGTLWAAGQNASGELGLGGILPVTTFTQVTDHVVAVAAGYTHTLFIKDDATLWAVGANESGQLGDGSTTSRTLPVQIASDVIAVAAGYFSSYFVKADRSAWAMGANESGQLGDGSTTSRTTPVQIATDVATISAGGQHSYVLKTDGTLCTAGSNSYGQLGDGSTVGHAPLTPLATEVVAVTAGTYSGRFLRRDGTVWAMGSNHYGCLGDGTTVDRLTPVSVATGASALAASEYSAWFFKPDGSLWGNGSNDLGQLGDGTTTDRLSPCHVADGLASICGSRGYSLLLDTTGTLRGIGDCSAGQLGDGTAPWQTRLLETSVVYASSDFRGVLLIKPDGGLWSQDWRSPTRQFVSPGVIRAFTGGIAARRAYLDAGLALTSLTADGLSTPLTTNAVGGGVGNDFDLVLSRDSTLSGRGGGFPSVRLSTNGDIVPLATNVAAVATSDWDSVFLKRDRTVWGVGVHFSNWSLPVSNSVMVGTDFVAVGGSSDTKLGIRTDGSLWRFNASWSDAGTQIDTGVVQAGVPPPQNLTVIDRTSNGARYLKNDGSLIERTTVAAPATSIAQSVMLHTVDPFGASLFIQQAGAGTAPVIVTAPASRDLAAGGTTSFAVSATGSAPLDFQWYRNGVALPMARSPELRLPFVTAGDAGAYSVTVTNSAGRADSAAAILTVQSPPAVAAGSRLLLVPAGTQVELTATATGSPAFNFQWRKDGISLPAVTGPTLQIAAASAADEGAYATQVDNPFGSAISEDTVALVTNQACLVAEARFDDVALEGTWDEQAGSLPDSAQAEFIQAGGRLSFLSGYPNGTASRSATRDLSLPLDQRWTVVTRLGLAPNATFAGLYGNGAPRDVGLGLQVSSPSAPAERFRIRFQVRGSATGVSRSVATELHAGTTTESAEAVEAADHAEVFVRLSFNPATALVTASRLSAGVWVQVSEFNPTDRWSLPATASLRVGLEGSATRLHTSGTQVWADDFAVVVRVRPAIQIPPANQLARTGSGVSFDVTAAGPGLGYQWLKDGAELVGANSPSLALSNVQPTEAGEYVVRVSNAEGAVTSPAATLVVHDETHTTYASWKSATFNVAELADPAVSGPLADPDGAGVTNLERFAFNLAARGPVPGRPADSPTILDEAGERFLSISFTRKTYSPGLTYTTEASDDLVQWETLRSIAPGYPVFVTQRDNTPVTGRVRRFMRVRVALVP